jgi:hypothetical protein
MTAIFQRLLLIPGLLVCSSSEAALKTSAGNGLWNNSATWSPSGVPACGDSIVILAAHTVTISDQQNYSGCGSRMSLHIKGTLYFLGGNKLRLPCNSSVYIYTGGVLTSDGSGNSNQLEVCGTTYWSGNNGAVNGPVCYPPAMCGVVLPVSLSRFSGIRCAHRICLGWQTESESSCDHFELWRSLNGRDYSFITSVPSKVFDEKPRSTEYGVTDQRPAPGTNYYRLHLVSTYGETSYSSILSVCANSGDNYALVVDKTSEMLTITTNDPGKSSVRVFVYSLMGAVLFSDEIHFLDDETTKNVAQMPHGENCFIVNVISGENRVELRKKILR